MGCECYGNLQTKLAWKWELLRRHSSFYLNLSMTVLVSIGVGILSCVGLVCRADWWCLLATGAWWTSFGVLSSLPLCCPVVHYIKTVHLRVCV